MNNCFYCNSPVRCRKDGDMYHLECASGCKNSVTGPNLPECIELWDMLNKADRHEYYDDNTMDDIETIVKGLPTKVELCMFNILKYWERRNRKGQHDSDIKKIRNYLEMMLE